MASKGEERDGLQLDGDAMTGEAIGNCSSDNEEANADAMRDFEVDERPTEPIGLIIFLNNYERCVLLRGI